IWSKLAVTFLQPARRGEGRPGDRSQPAPRADLHAGWVVADRAHVMTADDPRRRWLPRAAVGRVQPLARQVDAERQRAEQVQGNLHLQRVRPIDGDVAVDLVLLAAGLKPLLLEIVEHFGDDAPVVARPADAEVLLLDLAVSRLHQPAGVGVVAAPDTKLVHLAGNHAVAVGVVEVHAADGLHGLGRVIDNRRRWRGARIVVHAQPQGQWPRLGTNAAELALLAGGREKRRDTHFILLLVVENLSVFRRP